MKYVPVLAFLLLAAGCSWFSPRRTVPHEGRYGIYALVPKTGAVELLYSSDHILGGLHLNSAGDRFAFSSRIAGDSLEDEEICTVASDGSDFHRLTDNNLLDTYPCWSPDDSRIAFLSWRDSTLDIYVMNADGTGQDLLYESGFHDADISWVGDFIAFTRESKIWRMRSDGTDPVRITDPPRAGEWGNAPLPFGDYDPRLSPAADRIVFERLVDDASPHGNYDLFLVNLDGTGETRLTTTGYTQGMASWSAAGDRVVYVVSAVGTDGRYDLYQMNADGTDNKNITPDYFPEGFLCNHPVFSPSGATVYFIGEWWE